MKPRIVVIEDSVETLLVLERQVRGEATLYFATNVSEGLEKIRKHRPDLVLLDIELGNEGGMAVLAALRNDPATVQLPVIIMSSHDSWLMRRQMFKAGADNFLNKPLEPESLRAAIRCALNKAACADAPADSPAVLVINAPTAFASSVGAICEPLGVPLVTAVDPAAVGRLAARRSYALVVYYEDDASPAVNSEFYEAFRRSLSLSRTPLLVAMGRVTPERAAAVLDQVPAELLDSAVPPARLRQVLQRWLRVAGPAGDGSPDSRPAEPS